MKTISIPIPPARSCIRRTTFQHAWDMSHFLHFTLHPPPTHWHIRNPHSFLPSLWSRETLTAAELHLIGSPQILFSQLFPLPHVQLIPRPQGWPPQAPLLHHPQARDGGDGVRFHSAVPGDRAAPGPGGTGEVHREAPQVCHAPSDTDNTRSYGFKLPCGHHVVVWNNCDWGDINPKLYALLTKGALPW